ncbi:histidine kinase [Inhella sp. 4Y17]|uniref:Histidine kinase n=1 Tax=Inhella gelatinilytica TaxID=2795030 RepID=A0A931IXL4_9BURK|nr:histidine kinase [Inhella gelatinilytica]
MVLRALFLIQGAMALGLMLVASGPLDWWVRYLQSSVISMPALATWLSVVCGLRLRLAAWPLIRIQVALVALGAGSAWWPWWVLGHALAMDMGPVEFRGLGVALVGATLAGGFVQGLLWRARAAVPSGMQARWVELQARIRPHFLFNTLNTAVALVRVNPPVAERVLEDLADLFRGALATDGQPSTLATEVEMARRYLDIEQLRFGERLRVRWQLDAACDAARVPSLLLQPLLENAVRYGVEPNESGGDIEVRSAVRSGRVEVTVWNSVAAPAAGGHGLALANVRERMALLHDVSGSFEAEASARGFTVRIGLPLPQGG